MSDIVFLDEVDSTNNYIKSHLGELSDFCAVTAKKQTAGRGRRGHGWVTNEGMLPVSFLLKDPPERDTLTARVGLAVCGAIEEVCGTLKTAIKWPNDIIAGGFKVCGILCESVYFGDCANVIAGIGVNISQSAEHFKAAELPHAASLVMIAGKAPDRDELLKVMIEKLKKYVAMPFAECYDEYKARVLNLGREVKLVSADGSERVAVAMDIAPNGFLVCRDSNGKFEVSSGEVSVRGLDGYL